MEDSEAAWHAVWHAVYFYTYTLDRDKQEKGKI